MVGFWFVRSLIPKLLVVKTTGLCQFLETCLHSILFHNLGLVELQWSVLGKIVNESGGCLLESIFVSVS